MRLINKTRRSSLGLLRLADHLATRLLGLLITDPAKDNRPLWLRPCSAVHTFGMRYALDLVFLDRGLKVVKIALNVRPFRICTSLRHGTYSVIEFFSGTWDPNQIAVGDELEILP